MGGVGLRPPGWSPPVAWLHLSPPGDRRPCPAPPVQVVFYSLTVILVASFMLCAFVGHSFRSGNFPWISEG